MKLLDTDVMIDLLRRYPPALGWIESLGDDEILLPGFVVMELIQGCRDKEEQEKAERDLAIHEVIWPFPGDCDQALSVFTRTHLSHGIGIIDSIIGQLAMSLDLPLHTFNKKHYKAIPGLKTVQPYTRSEGSP